ncbi:MAG TPA: 8-oxo-dGTP diphosphatase MutT [Candidatus Berkiella sp.]|nr:8-oxo-dGTP diphosphatase MutT [Candidatus Berkiella sp.]
MRISVAVGVVFNEHGQVLVAKRLAHQHQGDCWEFPGGKIEPHENEGQALRRELFEEVGIVVTHHEAWMKVDHDYDDKLVCLIVHKITGFSGEPLGCEGQEVKWVLPSALLSLPFPMANHRIVKALQSS